MPVEYSSVAPISVRFTHSQCATFDGVEREGFTADELEKMFSAHLQAGSTSQGPQAIPEKFRHIVWWALMIAAAG